MPSGGYGVNMEDMDNVRGALYDDVVIKYGMQVEWVRNLRNGQSRWS